MTDSNDVLGTSPLSRATLRVARPTDDLASVVSFYRDGLGFQVIDQFEDHHGIDGAMLGFPGAPYHLEFTRHGEVGVGRAPTEDNLLVFYVADRDEWEAVVARMVDGGHRPVTSLNPYWDRDGITFEDPDGYRVVIQNAGWAV